MGTVERSDTCLREWSAQGGRVRIGRHAWEFLHSGEHIGRVVSVFRGGANALFESEALVSFHSPVVPLQPWGVEALLPWEHASENDPVAARAGDVRVGSLSLSLSHADAFDLRLSTVAEPITLKTLAGRAEVLKELTSSRLDDEQARSPDDFRAERQSILDAWVNGGTTDSLSQLIGLGTGLTPAGDDTLVGIFGGLEALASIFAAQNTDLDETRRAQDQLRATIRKEALGRTTLPSRQALCGAAEGYFCEPLLGLLEALCESDTTTAKLEKLAQSVLCLGHTSGADLLTGLIVALKWGLSRFE
jgi:hypothetical protein